MGRSPNWFHYVRPFPLRTTGSLPSLDAVFKRHLGEPMASASDAAPKPEEVEMAFAQIPSSTDTRVTIGTVSPLPLHLQDGLLRCCSTYGQEDEDCPTVGVSYRIVAVARYCFVQNAPEQEDAAIYDVLYVSHPDPQVMSTWALRTDGLVLNIESFQAVCWVDQAVESV